MTYTGAEENLGLASIAPPAASASAATAQRMRTLK